MNMKCAFLLTCLILFAGAESPAHARQSTVSVTVRVLGDDGPVVDARVTATRVAAAAAGATDTVATTNAAGEALLRLRSAVAYAIRVEKPGLFGAELPVTARVDTVLVVELHELVEHEEIYVSTTRTGRRIEDEPIRVEVVGREEVEEKLLMTPGDIVMLLNETAGLRVQSTSSSLGGASVRIQGLRGRYTQVLSDGLPLFGAQAGTLGSLQIPPMDLGQVEVIKGAASALYGASALGGVVNLISRRPAAEAERELLLNQSTLGGTDVIGWASRQIDDAWGYTLLASGHRQQHDDVDDDGWADVPAYRRAVVRPRIFWSDDRGSTVLFTLGGMVEDREGGTLGDGRTPDGSEWRETLETRRADAGLIGRTFIANSSLLSVRASGTLQHHDHGFGLGRERDAHATAFAEAALAGSRAAHTWVLGAAVQHENYAADDVTGFDYAFTIPGLFAQDEFDATSWLTLAGSARLDHHSRYGAFFNPRLSVLVRPADQWTVRASAGTGYFAPTPWVEETEASGLALVEGWESLEAERARNASLDVARTFGGLELNATVFGSRIDDAVQAVWTDEPSTVLTLSNAAGDVRTYGTELLARYHAEGVHVTATHVFTRSTEPDPETGVRRDVPLTPRHAVGLVAALEDEERGRVGAEFYYTGRQALDENPYRSSAPAHVIIGFLGERRFGNVRVFLNAENVLDTRQTRHDPLLLPARAAGGRWTTDAWAPLEGRSFNGGVRWFF